VLLNIFVEHDQDFLMNRKIKKIFP